MAVHECVTCAALPERPHDLPKHLPGRNGVLYRPRTPRPIDPRSRSGPHGGPRSHRCTTHYREHVAARRQAASDARSRKRSGLDERTRRAVLDLQGGRCPCGAGLGGRRLNLSADHDHERAAGHGHPDDVACEECMRGYLCHHCNREVIGFLLRAGRTGNASRTTGEVAAALRALAGYLDDPPMARLRRMRSA